MKCPGCKKEIPQNAKFCGFCGFDLRNKNTKEYRFNRKCLISILGFVLLLTSLIITISITGENKKTTDVYDKLPKQKVNIFIGNKYEKAMIMANFKLNSWIPALQNKISFCRNNLNNKEKQKEIAYNFELIRIAIRDEMKTNSGIFVVDYRYLDKLNIQQADKELFKELDEYLNLLIRYYTILNKKVKNKNLKNITECH